MALLNVPTPRFKPGSGVQQPQVQQVLREAPTPAAAQAGPTLTPEQVARKRAIAEQLAQSGMDYSPVQHWTQGLARVANALAGNMEEARADDAEKQGKRDAADQLTQLQAMRGEPGADPKSSIAMAMALADNPWATPGMKAIIAPMIQKDSETPEEKQIREYQLLKLKNDASGLTSDQKEYKMALDQGFTGSFTDYVAKTRPAPSTTVNVGGDNAFDKGIAEGQAKMFTDMVQGGIDAKTEYSQVNDLEQNLSKIPGGLVGGMQSLAAQWKIPLGPGAGSVQAADAIISKLIPAQRVPGSGSSSDRDFATFKAALPSLFNTTEGNALIIQTMKAMAQFKMDQSAIAEQVMTGDIDRKAAVRMLQQLPDPLAAFKARQGGNKGAAAPAGPAAAPPAQSPAIQEIDSLTGYGGKGGPEQFMPLPPENPDPYGIKAGADQRKATVARHQRMLSKPLMVPKP
jgi:hypothetical protein